MLEMIYRMFEAQPYLIKLWDCSYLFDKTLDNKLQQSPNHQFLLLILREMVCSNEEQAKTLEAAKSVKKLDFVSGLTDKRKLFNT